MIAITEGFDFYIISGFRKPMLLLSSQQDLILAIFLYTGKDYLGASE